MAYKVENAVIMAAGLSSRFAPLSYEKPKALITVKGEVLIERQIRMPIIFLTAHGDIPLAVKAMQRGAVDFLTKPVDTDHLIAAIERALRVDTLHRHGFNAQADLDWTLNDLRDREKDVLRLLLLENCSNKQIAERLRLSERTVENYRANIYRRLNVHGTDELRQLLNRPQT